MRRYLVPAALVLFGAVAYAGLTFALAPDAGVAGVPTGITQARFPPPGVARDSLVAPFLQFECVNFDIVKGNPTADPPTQDTKVWHSWKRSIDATEIVAVEECTVEETPDFVGYVQIRLRDPDDAPIVRGDFDRIQAILAQTTGRKTIRATFTETR